MHILQCDYFKRRHLDKVNQSDYGIVTIYSEKSIIITTKWNKLNGSKSTNYNEQAWPFKPAKESRCFPRGPLDRVTEAKDFSDSYIFDFRQHVIAKCGNSSERNSWYNVNDKITARVKEICLLGVVCKVSSRKTLSGETFCFHEKRLLSILPFFSRAADDWLRTNFLGMYSYFPIIRLVNIL